MNRSKAFERMAEKAIIQRLAALAQGEGKQSLQESLKAARAALYIASRLVEHEIGAVDCDSYCAANRHIVVRRCRVCEWLNLPAVKEVMRASAFAAEAVMETR